MVKVKFYFCIVWVEWGCIVIFGYVGVSVIGGIGFMIVLIECDFI